MPVPTSPILRATLRCVPALLAFAAGLAVAALHHHAQQGLGARRAQQHAPAAGKLRFRRLHRRLHNRVIQRAVLIIHLHVFEHLRVHPAGIGQLGQRHIPVDHGLHHLDGRQHPVAPLDEVVPLVGNGGDRGAVSAVADALGGRAGERAVGSGGIDALADHGTEYAVVSCYNSLKTRGGAHSLVRLNLAEAVRRHVGGVDAFVTEALPHWVELTAELGEARIRSLVEEQRFFETNFLATEGLIDLDRFSLMFGIFGLAECVNELMAREGKPEARYGHDVAANEVSWRLTRRIAELVAERRLPYCGGGGGFGQGLGIGL